MIIHENRLLSHHSHEISSTLIETSNRSVLKVSFLENYIFLTNEIDRTIFNLFFMFIPEMTCSLTLFKRLGRISFINLDYCLL